MEKPLWADTQWPGYLLFLLQCSVISPEVKTEVIASHPPIETTKSHQFLLPLKSCLLDSGSSQRRTIHYIHTEAEAQCLWRNNQSWKTMEHLYRSGRKELLTPESIKEQSGLCKRSQDTNLYRGTTTTTATNQLVSSRLCRKQILKESAG